MANYTRKFLCFLLMIIGVIVILLSLYNQIIYLAYIGLGVVFWGIILGFIISDEPLLPEKEYILIEKASNLNLESDIKSILESKDWTQIEKNPNEDAVGLPKIFDTVFRIILKPFRRMHIKKHDSSIGNNSPADEPITSTPYKELNAQVPDLASPIITEECALTGNVNRLTSEPELKQKTWKYFPEEQQRVEDYRFIEPERTYVEIPRLDPRIREEQNKRIEEAFAALERSKEEARVYFEQCKITVEPINSPRIQNYNKNVSEHGPAPLTKQIERPYIDPRIQEKQKKRVNEAFAALEQSRESAREFYKKHKNNREQINPKFQEYTLQINTCPLRIHDSQDCGFCEAKNCQERLSPENG